MLSKLGVILTVLVCAFPSFGGAAEQADIVLGDFDGAEFEGWRVEGEAFASPHRDAELLRRQDVANVHGAGVASSELHGDEPQGKLASDPFVIERDYIGFHIAGGNHETHTCLNLVIDGKVVRSTTGENCDTLFPASWDVRQWRGRHAVVEVVDHTGGTWGHVLADHIVLTDSPEQRPTAIAPLYHEAFRPQFHLTARQWTTNRLNPGMRQEGWINDLNGMIYYHGEWHVFAQRWAECWLHFVSKDLIHWTELEPAFWEEWNGGGVQSGYTVIDYHNTSGLGVDPDNPPFIAFYPQWDNRNQCIAYSLDYGRSWTRYEKNPVLSFPERDPKVFWYEPGGHWCMVLYGGGKYHFFVSDNLLDWRHTSELGNCFECPDFFQLAVDGDQEQQKWVLIHADGGYQLGAFDGEAFTPDYRDRIYNECGEYYAAQTFHNTDTGDKRRVQLAWVRFSNFPGMPFNQMLSFPGELTLRTTPKGPRLHRLPVAEVATLHKGEPLKWSKMDLSHETQLAARGQLFHIQADVEIPQGSKVIFNLRGQRLTLEHQGFQLDHHRTDTIEPIEKLEVLVDRTSIEVYVNDGQKTCTHFFIPAANGPAANFIDVRGEGAGTQINELTLNRMRSIWPEKPAH